MFEFIDIHPSINVQEAEYKRLLGFPRDHELQGRSRELADWARQWYAEHGKPWVYARHISDVGKTNGRLHFNGSDLFSNKLFEQMTDAMADQAVAVAISAGKECEEKAAELWNEEKPDEYFFLEMYGSAVVEHLVVTTGFRFCEWADGNETAVLPHYSPGYPGWDISDQRILLSIINRGKQYDFPGEIRVLETGMLYPKKSLLAVFGITSHCEKVQSLTRLIPCENCSLPACQYRRAPYRHALPQIENVRNLQTPKNGTEDSIIRHSGLKTGIKYSVSAHALEKWSQERLQLKTLHGGMVEARFRFEGTTCSNMGRPLQFDYYVKLASPADGYRILETECAPTPGDTGYKSMCEYLTNSDSLMKSIANEKPLLNKHLDEIANWKREFSPSGCYCDIVGREHKWGLVFEVLHYALAQKEKSEKVG
jgi:hypothetical protein